MIGRFAHRAAVMFLCAAFLLPLLWMVAVSLFPEGTALASDPWESAADPRFGNYAEALERMGNFPRLLFNTTLITILSIAGQVITCSLAGYAFARLRFRGRDALFLLVLATMMLPPQLTTIPQFLLFRRLGLIDTFAPLILPTIFGGAPFFIFLFRQAFLTIPKEVVEAARVDGCGFFQTFFRVMLPLVKPTAATVGIFTFLATWNDFWSPLIYLASEDNQTLTLALTAFNRSYNTAVELMMAAAGVILFPCALVYFLFQRLFIRGISVAASKG